MARYRGPKSKIARRFKEPIFGPSKALDKKKYGPGQHGRNRRRKASEYSIQLNEKQKAKYIYGLLERQFRNTFVRAAAKKGVTGTVFLQMLEARLDNTVFRMGFAPTRRAARQLVNHKHVMVNGVVTNIPSMILSPGDKITIREKSQNLELVQRSLGRSSRFSWLDVAGNRMEGTFLNFPDREDIPENINEQLIVELYSK
ncbi:MAG: 30S ribosomal protein S4 [Bacteroidetes bacterium]|nr:MAG: 30S ribosomal protein S4 [Bacteroidota bacterium]